MKRNYPLNYMNTIPSERDEKMVKVSEKTRLKYEDFYKNRPHTILLEKNPPKIASTTFMKNGVICEVPPPPVKSKDKTKVHEGDVQMCQAMTIKTNAVCSRKAKPNSCFCGMHTKKP